MHRAMAGSLKLIAKLRGSRQADDVLNTLKLNWVVIYHPMHSLAEMKCQNLMMEPDWKQLALNELITF